MSEWQSARRGRLAIWFMVASLAILSAPLTLISAQDRPEASGWPFYGADLQDTRAVGGPLDADSVAGLEEIWSVEVGGPVSATPVIAAGTAYAGSYDGTLYAIDLSSGDLRWTYDTGAAVPEPNLGIDLGITGSAAVMDGTVYVGDAAASIHALDADTGEVRWTARADDQEAASIWSSPVVWNGTVFVGVASIAKEEGFRGNIVALDAASGERLWQTFMVPEGADGAGVFGVPAIDEERGLLFVGTQNAYSENPAPYGNPISVVAVDVASGEIRWVVNAPPNDGETSPVDDVGFSASPNLFSATIEGQERALVGIGQKSGVYWALDRESGDIVWQTQVSPAGFLGGMEGTAAVSGDHIAVPATDWPEFDGPAAGMVTVLDAATGETVWSTSQDAPAASPASIANDLVFHAGMDGILHAYALDDGAEIWSADLGASVSGGIGIANGVVVLGAATPEFAPFVQAGSSIRAFGLGAQAATPIASPEASPMASPVASPEVAPEAAPGGEEVVVDIRALAYQTPEIEIPAGTTVTWTNSDTVAHTVTHDVPEGERIFNSGLFGPGESWSYTFDTPGTFPYFCIPHPFMEGTVTVTE